MSIEKTELRKLMRARKRALDETQKQRAADAVFAAVEALDVFRNAQHILLYYSLPDELPTHRIVQRWAQSKTVYLPRVKGDDLEIVPYDDSLSDDNAFHIGEPQGEAVDPACLQMIVVPGVAFDLHGNRMGRGKGFYDRLLATTPRAFKLGVALDCQIVDDIPVEPHDKPMDAILTPSHHWGQTSDKLRGRVSDSEGEHTPPALRATSPNLGEDFASDNPQNQCISNQIES